MSNVIRFPKPAPKPTKPTATAPAAPANVVPIATLSQQKHELLDLTSRGFYREALTLGEKLVLRLHEQGDHTNARSLAVTGLPALRRRLYEGR